MSDVDLSGAILDATVALQADRGCRRSEVLPGYCAIHGRWVYENDEDPGYCLAARLYADVAVRAAAEAIAAALGISI